MAPARPFVETKKKTGWIGLAVRGLAVLGRSPVNMEGQLFEGGRKVFLWAGMCRAGDSFNKEDPQSKI